MIDPKWLTKTGRVKQGQPTKIKTDQYIQKFTEIHGEQYDYAKVVYTGTFDKVIIVCPHHGEFTQTPNNHLMGQGCPKCQGNVLKTLEEVVQEFVQTHGGIYDYSQVEYKGMHSKVIILCNTHGVFEQTPDNHLRGQGCPKCQNHNQDTLYLLRCENTHLIKIGITNNITRRIKQLQGNLTLIKILQATNPKDLERELHLKYRDYNEYNPTVLSGNTEFFRLNDTQIQELLAYLEVK